MIEKILLFIFFTTWTISLIGTFTFGVIIDKHKSLEKYTMGCGIVALVTTLTIALAWW